MKSPLFRDPIYDGAADPVVIWNRSERSWWMVYTNRRATAEGEQVAWVHGTDLGVASSADGGGNWLYRGILSGLDIDWGRNTFWAPEIIWHQNTYHMYVSYIRGVPEKWAGYPRRMLHYTSPDLIAWHFEAEIRLSSDKVIDACIHEKPDGGFRMWYKDEGHDSHTYAADSEDLCNWFVTGPVILGQGHEGPNVFRFKGHFWMIVDEWRGLGVYRSNNMVHWERNGMILDKPGKRADDGTIGHHADVVVQGDEALIFYFTHPGRIGAATPEPPTHALRRSSIQAARLDVADGLLVCDRDAEADIHLVPDDAV